MCGRGNRMLLYTYSGYIPLLSYLGCVRNGLRVISYFIWPRRRHQLFCLLVILSPFRPIIFTFSFLAPSRSNTRQKQLKCACVLSRHVSALCFVSFVLASSFYFSYAIDFSLLLRLCSFVRRRRKRNKGLLEFLEACACCRKSKSFVLNLAIICAGAEDVKSIPS